MENNVDNNNIIKNAQNEKMAINADQLLEKLKLEMPEDAYCVFGIIDNDLYTESLSYNGKRLIKST